MKQPPKPQEPFDVLKLINRPDALRKYTELRNEIRELRRKLVTTKPEKYVVSQPCKESIRRWVELDYLRKLQRFNNRGFYEYQIQQLNNQIKILFNAD